MMILLLPTAVMGQSKLEENFDKLAEDILENLQAYYPVMATEKGIHDYDYAFTDYSRSAVKSEIAKLKKFETRLYKYQKTNLSGERAVSLKLLKSNVDMALHELNAVKSYENNPYLYLRDVVNGIYLIMISDYPPPDARVFNIIARFKGVPDFLQQGRENLESPPPIFIEMAKEMAVTGIEFYRSVDSSLSEQFPELAQEIHTSATRATEAMYDFALELDEIEPGPPGSFALGRKDFDYKLKHEYFFDFDSDSLLKIGQALFDETKVKYAEYLASLDSTANDDDIFVIDCIDRQDILDYYQWEVEQTKKFLIDHDIVTVPEDIGPCRVVETPTFLTSIISSIAYQPPGAFNPAQTGYFYVRPVPDSMDQKRREASYKYISRRGFKGSVVHEAYPGHHFQFQIASRIDSDIRKWQENICFIEGWALYCEEMMYHQGLYRNDPRRYLNILRGILFRAARIIVDVKLHTGQMTPDEAVVWMAEALDTDTTWLRIEINRYAMTPTIQMAYLTGKIAITELRDALMAREDENFSLKNFHDRLLAEGAVPPRFLWDIWELRPSEPAEEKL